MLSLILTALVVSFAISQISSFCTTIYLHRAMAHKGLRLHPAVGFVMQVWLWMYTGIVTREWVAVHRKHHHFTDEEGDPHSPHLKGLWPVLLWNAVYYAREANKPEVIAKYTRDMPPTRAEVVMSRGWVGLAIGMATFVGGFGLAFGGVAAVAVGAIAFLTQGVVYIVLNAMVNGACHVLGYKNFNNTATNLRWVAWFSAGEGLHNNHHQYPAAAKLSMKRWEFDPAWPVIKMLSKLKLATPLPLPNLSLQQQEQEPAVA